MIASPRPPLRSPILTLLAMLLLAASALAQAADGPRGERGGHGARDFALLEQLDLTDAQRAEIATLKTELRAEGRALREAARAEGTRPDRAAMRALMERGRSGVDAILTEEQRARLGELREDRRAEHRERRARLAPMRDELRAYRAEEIIPVMAALRGEFDAELSAAERARIAELREALRSARAERRGRAGQPDRARRDDLAREHEDELRELRAIAAAHRGELDAVRDRIETHRAAWTRDVAAIRAKYDAPAPDGERDPAAAPHHRGDDPRQRRDRRAPRGDRALRDKRAHRAHRGDRGGARGAILFLLMDPEGIAETGFDEGVERTVRIYPNPAADRTNVTFEVREAGEVRIDLIDAGGRATRTLHRADYAAGTHTVAVDLPPGASRTTGLRVSDATGERTVLVTRR